MRQAKRLTRVRVAKAGAKRKCSRRAYWATGGGARAAADTDTDTSADTDASAVVAAKTDPAAGAKGISLIIVDATMAGFTKGRPLKKIGLKSQDTGELFFENVRVPVTQLLGQENAGFAYLMQELPWERLQIGISAVAAAEAAYTWTVEYVRNRHAFGKMLVDFQNTRFVLADLKTQIEIGRTFIDRCITLLLRNKIDA